MWCVNELDDEYIERMEDILDLYDRQLSYKEPVICLEGKPLLLRGSKKPFSRRNRKGKIIKRDYEYVRKGSATGFCVVEPKRGKHFIFVRKRRKSADFARIMQKIGKQYRNAEKIHIVFDNLSTHSKKVLVQTLGAKRGKSLWERFHVHFTPKHASWLNQAETQISMYSRECLGRDRIGTIATLKKRTQHWIDDANRRRRKINWGFTTSCAREKFGYCA